MDGRQGSGRMPIYTYQCVECGHKLEILLRENEGIVSNVMCDCGEVMEKDLDCYARTPALWL